MKKRKAKLVPGTVSYTGRYTDVPIHMHYIEFNEDRLHEESSLSDDLKELHTPKDEVVQWYDLQGLHNDHLIEEIGKVYVLHPLILEDVTDVRQRPKWEEYKKGYLIVLNAVRWDKKSLSVEAERVSIFTSDGFVLSFQENEEDQLDDVRERIRSGRGRIRSKGADYLSYALLDDIIDQYFDVLNEITTSLEEYEERIATNPTEALKYELYDLKRELRKFRRAVFPIREAILSLETCDNDIIKEATKPFLRNLYSHTIQIADSIDSTRDVITGLQDLYNSELGFRMNKVMQLLTVITTIFVPLSFVAAVYGMNFEQMPELRYKYSYFILWVFMALSALLAVVYFKKKKWL